MLCSPPEMVQNQAQEEGVVDEAPDALSGSGHGKLAMQVGQASQEVKPEHPGEDQGFGGQQVEWLAKRIRAVQRGSGGLDRTWP